DTAVLHLLTEPSNELVERDDVVSVVPQRRRRDGQSELSVSGQVQYAVFFDRPLDRRPTLLPVRHQFLNATWIHDRAGNDVGAVLLTLLKNGDGNIVEVGPAGKLPQVVSRCKTGGSATDNQHIDFKCVALGHVLRIARLAIFVAYRARWPAVL